MVQEQLPADTDAGARADLVLSYVLGRWARYAKGGFKGTTAVFVSDAIEGGNAGGLLRSATGSRQR